MPYFGERSPLKMIFQDYPESLVQQLFRLFCPDRGGLRPHDDGDQAGAPAFFCGHDVISSLEDPAGRHIHQDGRMD